MWDQCLAALSLDKASLHICLPWTSLPICSASPAVCASLRTSLMSISSIRNSESASESVPSSILIPCSSSWNTGRELHQTRLPLLVPSARSGRQAPETFALKEAIRQTLLCYEDEPSVWSQVVGFTHHVKTTTQRLQQSLVRFVHESRLDFRILLFFLQERARVCL